MKKFFIILSLSLLLAFFSFGESASESSQILLTCASGSNVDIDGNEQFDTLTDGLLVLRSMFGLDGDALVTGTVASDAAFTASADIEFRIATLGDLADIDGNSETDALTDGLLTLWYLFGLEGDTLIAGVVASDTTITNVVDIEAHLKILMPAL